VGELANAAAGELGLGFAAAELLTIELGGSCAANGGNAYLSMVLAVASAGAGVIAEANCGSAAGAALAAGIG
jgi:hypothetical protein